MSSKIDTFRKLHQGPAVLLLPNAWDAGSARLFESLGAPAIATTSAGMAWSLGYQDGRVIDIHDAMAAARRIERAIKVPLTFDIENGYSDYPTIVAENVMRLVDLGVAGINIEDGPDKPALLVAKIEAIRNALSKAGADLFINARSDVFLAELVDTARRVEESIARGRRYEQAGANGLFFPALHKEDDIATIVGATTLPVNVLAWPGLGTANRLAELGVRRLSAGSGISQALWLYAGKFGTEFLKDGQADFAYAPFSRYADIQSLLDRKR